MNMAPLSFRSIAEHRDVEPGRREHRRGAPDPHVGLSGPVSSLEHTFRLPAGRGRVFELFADPRRLDSLTPPWFRLRPMGRIPARLGRGTEISYRLRWRGLPLRWTSRLTDWSEGEFLAYEQRRGPYRFFRHEHFFRDTDGGTEVQDRVTFRAPGGALVDRWIARPDLRRIFDYRERQARALLSGPSAVGPLTRSRPGSRSP